MDTEGHPRSIRCYHFLYNNGYARLRLQVIGFPVSSHPAGKCGQPHFPDLSGNIFRPYKQERFKLARKRGFRPVFLYSR